MNLEKTVFYHNKNIQKIFLTSNKCKRTITVDKYYHLDRFFLEFPNIYWNIDYKMIGKYFCFNSLKLVGFDELDSFDSKVYSLMLPNHWHNDEWYGYTCLEDRNIKTINEQYHEDVVGFADSVIQMYWSAPFAFGSIRVKINDEIITDFDDLQNKLDKEENPKVCWHDNRHPVDAKRLKEFDVDSYYSYKQYEQLGLPLFSQNHIES